VGVASGDVFVYAVRTCQQIDRLEAVDLTTRPDAVDGERDVAKARQLFGLQVRNMFLHLAARLSQDYRRKLAVAVRLREQALNPGGVRVREDLYIVEGDALRRKSRKPENADHQTENFEELLHINFLL